MRSFPPVHILSLAVLALSLGAGRCAWCAPAKTATASAEAPRPAAPANPSLAPAAVTAATNPEEKAGTQLIVKWRPAAKSAIPRGLKIVGYQVLVSEAGKEFKPAGNAAGDATEGKASGLKPGRQYMVQVVALFAPPDKAWYAPGEKPPEGPEKPVEAVAGTSAPVGPVVPVGLWFDATKANVLTGVLLYTLIVIFCFFYARRGDMYVRPIAGLQAVDDAIGRATEMGKPLLFVSGLSGIGDISTIASVLVLGHLARRTAAYETPILVPCNDPLVMAADREIVREAYLEAGRPENFRPDNIFFVTDSQFGYVAAVDGIMVREKPAANFYMGYFYAESLILAETGNLSGAIQIAGTDADTQIPFFITACDYTLMGEELYAASAYLSRHPTLLAQLKGQDIGKAVMTALLILAALGVTVCQLYGWKEVGELILKWFGS